MALPANQWMVTVTITPTSRLGVDADWSDGKSLYIKAIMPGAIAEFNKENSAKSLQPGDRIISVNGVQGNASSMVKEIKERSLLQLLCQKADKDSSAEPEPVHVPGVVRAGVPLNIPGMPPRTVDILLELRAKAAEKAGEFVRKGPREKNPDDPPSHYEVLGIDLGADDATVKRSYRKLVLQWHPDKHPAEREEAEVKIRQINAAYETVGNPLKRSTYDQMLQAVERRRLGIRLETQFIKPRMSIPKEFMLCPLGHPDKFVRVLKNKLVIQSREDAPGVAFQEFFQAAKFSLWWLPEVNNMCRLRAKDTAGQGMDGGSNVSFVFKDGQEEDQGVESTNCALSTDQDMKKCNVIVAASPFIQGAFRFEAAFWPGRYLAYRPADTMLMAGRGKVDDGSDIADFMLVEHSAAYKFMTTSEVLKGAVDSQGGAQGGYVKLSDLRSDLSVRLYFQQNLGTAVWNNKDFETFFDGHFDEWDFDVKKSRVRMRPDGPLLNPEAWKARMAAPKGEKDDASEITADGANGLADRLRNTSGQNSTVRVLMSANGDDLAALPPSVAVPVLGRLAEKLELLTPEKTKDLLAARRRFLITLPVLLGEGAFGGKKEKKQKSDDELALNTLLGMHKAVLDIQKQDSAKELSSACSSSIESIMDLIPARIRTAPEEVSLDLLPELLKLPLNWRVAGYPLGDALVPLLKKQQPGNLLGPLQTAAKLGKDASPVVEALTRVEMKGLAYADGAVAADILTALAENSLELSTVASKLRPPLLPRLPLPELVSIVAALGERGVEADLLRPPLQARVAVAGPRLAAVEPNRLLRLANASNQSPCIAECALGAIAGAAAASLESWTATDVSELMLLTATSSSDVSGSPGAKRLFSTAIQVLGPQLTSLNNNALLKVVIAAGSSAAHGGRQLLELAANRAVQNLADMKPEQLMLLTQGVLPLGSSHNVVAQLLNHWAQFLAGALDKEAFSADDMAQLAMLVSLVAPETKLVFHVIALRLQEVGGDMTEAGLQALDAAFPKGAGPEFPGKEPLMKLLADLKEKLEAKKKEEAEAALEASRKRKAEEEEKEKEEKEKEASKRSRKAPRGDRSRTRSRSRSSPRRRR